MEQWANYFIVDAGAAAALTGLIFVAVSLNLQAILSIPHLADRALGSLVLLANILLVSSLCLVPQSSSFLGSEVLTLSILMWILTARIDVKVFWHIDKHYKFHAARNIVFTQLAVIPYIVGGIYLLTCTCEVGYYWLIPGIVFSFIKSLTDAWVLLVEIKR